MIAEGVARWQDIPAACRGSCRACRDNATRCVQIKNMKEYIARFGHGSAKLARQAQSKEKTLAKMVAEGLTEKVTRETTVQLKFENVGKLPPPVLQVCASAPRPQRHSCRGTRISVCM